MSKTTIYAIFMGLFISFLSTLSFADEQEATTSSTIVAPQEYLEILDENGESTIYKIVPSAQANVQQAAATCVRYTNTVTGGPLAPGAAAVAYGPYTTNCAGYQWATLTPMSSASLTLSLQKYSGGSWSTVATEPVMYNGTAGTYRRVVANSPYSSQPGYWSLKYSFLL